MANTKPEDMSEIELLQRWIDAVGGNVFLGESTLKSVKESKDGDKLTIVLKKKTRKAPDQTQP
ncbi:MAG: hypothetical protein FD148_1798 [Methylocystaceae bacterium]|nr:MAG: hypothetical protein FD148_1798 [Methylocystaceae bacterium]